jgi:hypothetical protein
VGDGEAEMVSGELRDDGETAVETVQVEICFVEIADFEGRVN